MLCTSFKKMAFQSAACSGSVALERLRPGTALKGRETAFDVASSEGHRGAFLTHFSLSCCLMNSGIESDPWGSCHQEGLGQFVS